MSEIGPNESIEAILKERLASLNPVQFKLIDDSAQHAGHAGARGGGGHYRLLLVSDAFTGKSTLARHRLVYSFLDDLMRSKIHALSIHSMTPEEARQ